MKFVKLKIKNSEYNSQNSYWQNKFNIYWVLLLRTQEEVMKYMRLDAEMYSKSLLSMRREDKNSTKDVEKHGNVRLDHLGSSREQVLGTYISCHVLGVDKDTVMWPHEILSDIVMGKGKALLSVVENSVIQINHAGGWCLHDAFVDMHKCEIIDELEKDSCTLPIDDKPIKTKVLILENGTTVSDSVESYGAKLSGQHSYGNEYLNTIRELKEKDSEWVAKSIAGSKIIVMETQAIDDAQLDSFMKLFSQLTDKKIHIRTSNKDVIKNHPLFTTNESLHTITFF